MFSVKKPIFGCNYYPEAWDRNQIDTDLDRMQEFGMNCVRIAEFAWKTMEPREGEYDFSLMREVVEKCQSRGISVILCTPTACPPRWLEEKYPEILLENYKGERMVHGGRRNVCPNNPVYRKYCARIVEAMAREFAGCENVIGWQIDNEVDPEKETYGCCCPVCENKFREWLKKKYGGDIEKLNRAWGNYIFSQQYDDFGQFRRPHPALWHHPGFLYYWGKFQNESYLEYIQAQYDILKKYVSVPVGEDGKPIFSLDYDALSRMTDVMQFNHYNYGEDFYKTAFWCDYLRPMKERPFWITETSCCWNGSNTANYMRPQNFNEANVWITYFLGAELSNYWLWRAHYGGQELMHGAVISSCGRPSHVAEGIRAMAKGLDKAAQILEKTKVVKSGIGIHASFTSYEMFRFQGVTPEFQYTQALQSDFYYPVLQAHLRPDVLAPSVCLDGYKLIFTPFMLNLDEANLGARMLEWVAKGGIWVVGPMTDIRTSSAAKYIDRAMGYCEQATGAKLLYTLPKGEQYELTDHEGGRILTRSCTYDVYESGETSEVFATYRTGAFTRDKAGMIVSNYKAGKIILLGFVPEASFMAELALRFAAQAGIYPCAEADRSVVCVRREGCGIEALCAVEIQNKPAKVTVPFDCEEILSGEIYKAGETYALAPYGVALFKQVKK